MSILKKKCECGKSDICYCMNQSNKETVKVIPRMLDSNNIEHYPMNKITSSTEAWFAGHGEESVYMTPVEPQKNVSLNVESSKEEKISYKYAEDKIISDFKNYIDKTYGQHYKTENQNIQAFDAWIALGDATPTFRNTAIKYLWRYGKKKGNNKDDLMKTLHYTLMCLFNDHYKGNDK